MKVFAIFALITGTLYGVSVALVNGISANVFATNFLGLIAAVGFILSSEKIFHVITKNLIFSMAIGLILLGSTLFFKGYDGVHRWIQVGPVQLNISMVIAPIFSLGLQQLRKEFVLILNLIIAMIFLFQPDLSQLTSFAALSTTVLIFREDLKLKIKATCIILVLFFIATTYSRKVTLAPVAHVEEILRLAFSSGILFAFGAGVTLILLMLPMIIKLIQSDAKLEWSSKRHFIYSILAYWIVNFLFTVTGDYPVPVIGVGAAGVLGLALSYVLIIGYRPFDSASNLSRSI